MNPLTLFGVGIGVAAFAWVLYMVTARADMDRW